MNKWAFDEKTRLLDNGLKIITIRRDTMLASINIGVKIGALYERTKEKGICHFIEHMMFKGTKSKSNEELNSDLESLGGEYNAYTDYTSTVYSINCLGEEIKNATNILADMLLNSTIDEEELDKERGVILAEIRTRKDDVEDISFDRTNELAFKKSPLRNDVLGTEKTVSSFKSNDLKEFYKKYYTPDNSIIVMVSALNHEEMQDIILKSFNNWTGNLCEKIDVIREKNKSIKKVTYKNNIEQSTITYLFSFMDVKKEDEMPLRILNHKLGESANSILFRELRENRGLAYDVYSSMDLSKNMNIMNIFTAVSEESIEESKNVIDKCIEDIKSRKIIFDEKMLSVTKKIHKTGVISTLEDSSELCHYALAQSLEGESLHELVTSMDLLEKIKPEDLYEVANKYLNNPTIHILKPKR